MYGRLQTLFEQWGLRIFGRSLWKGLIGPEEGNSQRTRQFVFGWLLRNQPVFDNFYVQVVVGFRRNRRTPHVCRPPEAAFNDALLTLHGSVPMTQIDTAPIVLATIVAIRDCRAHVV